MRKLACFLAAVLCLLPLGILTVSGATDFPMIDGVGAVLLLHAESGRVVGRRNENKRVSAGGSVKLLSGLVACEQLGAYTDETVTVGSAMIASSGGQRYRLEAGDVYTWREILLLALCGGYNDAYDVIAYAVGGSQAAYVEMLNARAKELGATGTYIADPSGVGDNSYTTAADLALIAQAAMQNSLYLSFVGAKSGETDSGDVITNRNRLVTDSASTGTRYTGFCVGNTDNAGVTLVALAQKENDSYLAVLMDVRDENGESSETEAYSLARSLIRWGYANYTNLEVLSPKTKVCTVPVAVSDMVDEVAVRPSESLFAYLPAGSEVGRDIQLSIRLSVEELEAPVSEGVPVGFVAAIYGGEIIGTVPLETAESAERSGFVSRLLSIRNLTKSRRVRAGVIFFLVCMTVWIGGETYLRRRTKTKWRQYYSSRSKWK